MKYVTHAEMAVITATAIMINQMALRSILPV